MINDIARKSINVDTVNNIPVATVKELDDFILKLSLMKYNTPFDATGQTVSLGVKAPSGLYEQTTDITINKEQVDIKLKTGIVAKAGTCAMELKLVDATGSMTTASFFIVVNPKILSDGAVQASDQFDIFTKTAAKVEADYNSLKKVIIDENNAANLQDQINKSNSQLAEIPKQTYSKSYTNNTKGVVSFYLDDAYANDYDIVLPYASSIGVPITFAAIYAGHGLTIPQMHELEDKYGWELHSHTYNHKRLDQISYAEKVFEIGESAKKWREEGFKCNGICYPEGFFDADVLKIVREHYKMGMSSLPRYNDSCLDTFVIKRVLTDSTSLEELKNIVDNIGSQWLIFYSHSNIFVTQPDIKQKYFDIMAYVKNKNIETLTVSNAFERYKNRLDLGDDYYDKKSVKVGYDGKTKIGNIPTIIEELETAINDKPITYFEDNKIIVCPYSTQRKCDIPFDSGIGTFTTCNLYGSNAIYNGSYQTFYGYRGTNVERYWTDGSGWSNWASIDIVNNVANGYTNASLVSDFPPNKITISSFISSDNSGIPFGSGIGTLVTDRLVRGVATLNHQTFYPYNGDYFVRRRANSDGTWKEWKEYYPSVKFNQSITIGSVPANSYSRITVSNVKITDIYANLNISFPYGLASGLLYNASITGVGTIVITFFNMTSSPIDGGNRNAYIQLS